MLQADFAIQRKEQLNATTYAFTVDCPKLAEESWCGRFVHIRCGEKPLRRPISICEIDKENGTITLVFEVRGEGTEWLASRKEGDAINFKRAAGGAARRGRVCVRTDADAQKRFSAWRSQKRTVLCFSGAAYGLRCRRLPCVRL